MNFIQYFKKIIAIRHFILHLVFSDIRLRYRRSFLGLSWAVLQPLILALLLAFVFGKVFGANIKEFLPFVFSGIVIWEFIAGSITSGCNSYIQSAPYIKQFKHPLLIYSIRTVLGLSINLFLAFFALIFLTLMLNTAHFNLSWLSLPIAFIFLITLILPITNLVALLGVRFIDLPNLMAIILQIIWYASPIFFEPKLFKAAKLSFLIDYNPIYHLLNLFRAPLLKGEVANINSYLYIGLCILIAWALNFFFIQQKENKTIFYL